MYFMGKSVFIKDGKIIFNNERKLEDCVELPFLVEENYLKFKDLSIPLIFSDERRKLARLFLLLSLSTSHEVFNCCENVKIFIDSKLAEVNLSNLKRGYTKICGNYGSTKLVYCISNESIAIMGKSENDSQKALDEIKEFVSLLSSINNRV